jgi:hypothetical protein
MLGRGSPSPVDRRTCTRRRRKRGGRRSRLPQPPSTEHGLRRVNHRCDGAGRDHAPSGSPAPLLPAARNSADQPRAFGRDQLEDDGGMASMDAVCNRHHRLRASSIQIGLFRGSSILRKESYRSALYLSRVSIVAEDPGWRGDAAGGPGCLPDLRRSHYPNLHHALSRRPTPTPLRTQDEPNPPRRPRKGPVHRPAPGGGGGETRTPLRPPPTPEVRTL